MKRFKALHSYFLALLIPGIALAANPRCGPLLSETVHQPVLIELMDLAIASESTPHLPGISDKLKEDFESRLQAYYDQFIAGRKPRLSQEDFKKQFFALVREHQATKNEISSQKEERKEVLRKAEESILWHKKSIDTTPLLGGDIQVLQGAPESDLVYIMTPTSIGSVSLGLDSSLAVQRIGGFDAFEGPPNLNGAFNPRTGQLLLAQEHHSPRLMHVGSTGNLFLPITIPKKLLPNDTGHYRIAAIPKSEKFLMVDEDAILFNPNLKTNKAFKVIPFDVQTGNSHPPAFSPNGSLALFVSDIRQTKPYAAVIDLTSKEPQAVRVQGIPKRAGILRQGAFASDNSIILTGENGYAGIFTVQNLENPLEFSHTQTINTNEVFAKGSIDYIAVSRDGSFALLASNDFDHSGIAYVNLRDRKPKALKLVTNPEDSKPLGKKRFSIYGLHLSSDGKRALVHSHGGVFDLYNLPLIFEQSGVQR